VSEEMRVVSVNDYELHFVVRFRVSDQKFYVDTDTADTVFHNGIIWTGHEWIQTEDQPELPLNELRTAAEETLIVLLDKGQELSAWMKARKID
jgi:hypothetical protein